MRRPIHMAMVRHISNVGFATFAGRRLSERIPCALKSSVGDGIHNFDFRKPVRIAPQENPVGVLHAVEG